MQDEATKAQQLVALYRKQISDTPALLSLLYDVNLMPEQISTTRSAISMAAVVEAYSIGYEDAIIECANDLVAVLAERDELQSAIDSRESSNGSLWRFWSAKALEQAEANAVTQERVKAMDGDFNRGVRAGCRAALAHLDRHDYREDVTRTGLQSEILAELRPALSQGGAK